MSKNKFLDDSSGNKSSKRLAGLCLIAQGLIMKIILFIYALQNTVATDFDKLDLSCASLIYAGVGILGWGVFEGKSISIKKE